MIEQRIKLNSYEINELKELLNSMEIYCVKLASS